MYIRKSFGRFVFALTLLFVVFFSGAIMSQETYITNYIWSGIGPNPGAPLCFEERDGVYPDGETAAIACASTFGVGCYEWAYGFQGWETFRYDEDYTPLPPGCGHDGFVHNHIFFPNHPEYSAQVSSNWTDDHGGSRQCAIFKEADPHNMESPIGVSPDNLINVNSSVDLKSGNVYHSEQVGPLTFSYNSLDSSNSPLGTGWTHDFNISIILNSDGSLFLKQFDGNTVWFVPGSGNTYYADVKSRDVSTIVKNADGSFTRTAKYGKVHNFNSSGQLTSIVDRNGNTTTLTYTGSNLTGITDSTGRTVALGVSGGKIASVTGFDGETSKISYSAAGLISSIADPLGNTWNFQYDSNNRMVQKTDPSNNVVSYTYDATSGMLTSTTDPNKMVISIAYSPIDYTTTVTEKDGGVWVHNYYSEFNVPLAITDPYGNKTTYAYDSNNNLLSITYPDGTSTAYTYDSNRNVTSVTDAGGRTTNLTYNSQNRVTVIQDPSGGTANITYDAKGNLSSYKDPAGALTSIQRDSKGNITSVTDPLQHTVSYGYDQYNNVISVTDPTNVAVNLTRDILGNVLGLTDALSNTTSFTYDADGQLTAAADPLGNAASFAYDKNGNRNSVTDPLQNVTTSTYDYRGRPTQQVDALKNITAFSYVATGCPSCGGGGEKLTSLTDAAGSTTNFAYDLRGLLTSVTDPLQKVTSLTYDVNGRATSGTDRNGTTLAYAYTPAGMLASITYPDSSRTTNTYDNLDRLTQQNDSIGTSSFSYDADGRITSFTDADGFTLAYVYNAAGNITQITYPDGSPVTYAYDAANRLTTVTDWLGVQATYAYDQDGRLAGFTHFNGIITTYTYDAASRLAGIANSVASYQFTLDGDGNRINSAQTEPLTPAYSLGSTVYGYNAQQNRLISAGALSYTYDNEGQLASAGGTGLTFDYNHRLVAIGTDTQFSYDGRGSRLIATRAGVTTHYIYDPWGNLLADADSNGITHKYIYGKGLLAVATPSARYCYHFNGTGSTVAITDMTQAVVNSYAYDPFGQILGQQETVTQPFKYVGQYGVMAEPNGLYYMRARYYDANVGRFISEDPLGFGGGDVNLFAYALGNPVSYADPEGLSMVSLSEEEKSEILQNAGMPPSINELLRPKTTEEVILQILNDALFALAMETVAPPLEFNPYGRRGSPAHRQKICEVENRLAKRGWITRSGGRLREMKFGNRFPDLVMQKGEKQIAIQVGRAAPMYGPISREWQAIQDLRRMEDFSHVFFIGY
jgi:RHS repeat-associated protein